MFFHDFISLVIVEETVFVRATAGNTIVSHFVLQRADLIVAIVCFPCDPRRSLIYACE